MGAQIVVKGLMDAKTLFPSLIQIDKMGFEFDIIVNISPLKD